MSNSTGAVYHIIKKMILDRDLPAGAKINQQRLAEDLNTSRTPVVKALHMLERERLADNIPNSGFSVHHLTLKELQDLFLIRQSFDSLAINSIVGRVTAGQLDMLRQIFTSFPKNGKWGKEYIIAYREADRIFHTMLLSMCENGFVQTIDDHYQIYARTYHGGLVRKPNITIHEHIGIIEALGSNDEETALRISHMHTEKTIEMIKSTIKRLDQLGYDGKNFKINDIDIEDENEQA